MLPGPFAEQLEEKKKTRKKACQAKQLVGVVEQGRFHSTHEQRGCATFARSSKCRHEAKKTPNSPGKRTEGYRGAHAAGLQREHGRKDGEWVVEIWLNETTLLASLRYCGSPSKQTKKAIKQLVALEALKV